MEGKYRERAKGVWCPRPGRQIFVEDEIDSLITGKKIGELAVPAKKHTGWTNMFLSCPGCEYLEEFHMDDTGVFCTYPKVAYEDELKE